MTNEPNVTHVMSNISDEQAMCIKQLHATVINSSPHANASANFGSSNHAFDHQIVAMWHHC
jgi:hypothetical protein